MYGVSLNEMKEKKESSTAKLCDGTGRATDKDMLQTGQLDHKKSILPTQQSRSADTSYHRARVPGQRTLYTVRYCRLPSCAINMKHETARDTGIIVGLALQVILIHTQYDVEDV